MNTKMVEQAIDETLQELLAMPTKDFKSLLKEGSSCFKKILLDGSFISSFSESTSKEELLKGFPDLTHNFTSVSSKSESYTKLYFNKNCLNTSSDNAQATISYSSDFIDSIERDQTFSKATLLNDSNPKITQPHKVTNEHETWTKSIMPKVA